MKNNFWPPAFVLALLFICTPAAAVAERKGDQTVVNQAKPGLGQTGFPIPQRAAAAPQRPVSSPPARFPTPAPAPTIHPQQMKNPAASNRVTGLPGFGSLSVGPAVSMTQLPPVAKPPVSGTNIVPSAPPRAINQYRPANGGANSGGVTRQVTEPQLGNKRPKQPPTLNLGATPVPRLTPQAPAANGEVTLNKPPRLHADDRHDVRSDGHRDGTQNLETKPPRLRISPSGPGLNLEALGVAIEKPMVEGSPAADAVRNRDAKRGNPHISPNLSNMTRDAIGEAGNRVRDAGLRRDLGPIGDRLGLGVVPPGGVFGGGGPGGGGPGGAGPEPEPGGASGGIDVGIFINICSPYFSPAFPLDVVPCPPLFDSWCWYPGFTHCYGYTNGVGLPRVPESVLIAELPLAEVAAQRTVVRIVPGTTVKATLSKKADVGTVLLQYGEVALPAVVVEMDSGEVTFTVPSVALKSPVTVQLMFLSPTGGLLEQVEGELVAATEMVATES